MYFSGAPRAPTHGIWSTSFRLVVTWLTNRSYARMYASKDCTGGIGETIKRQGGVSKACLGKFASFILDIHNIVNSQLSKQDSHWPVSHDHSQAQVSTHRGDVIYLEAVGWTVNCFSRSPSMFNLTFWLVWDNRKTDNAHILDINYVVINWQLSKQGIR